MVEAERWVALTVARTEYREVSWRFRAVRLGRREGAAMIRGGKMDIPTARRLQREGIRIACGRFCGWTQLDKYHSSVRTGNILYFDTLMLFLH